MRALLSAAVVTMLGFGALASVQAAPSRSEMRAGQSLPDEHQAQELACRPAGAVCKVMNGKNPEPSNDLCCSQHCNWNNGSQEFICD